MTTNLKWALRAALQSYHVSLVLLPEIAVVQMTTLLNPLVCSHPTFYLTYQQFSLVCRSFPAFPPLVVSSSLVALYTYQWWQRWCSPDNPCSLLLSMLLGHPLCLVLAKGNMSTVAGIFRESISIWGSGVATWKQLENPSHLWGKKATKETCLSLIGSWHEQKINLSCSKPLRFGVCYYSIVEPVLTKALCIHVQAIHSPWDSRFHS